MLSYAVWEHYSCLIPLCQSWLTDLQSRHVVTIYYLGLQYCHHCGNCWNLVPHTQWIYSCHRMSTNAWTWCFNNASISLGIWFRSSRVTASFTVPSPGRQEAACYSPTDYKASFIPSNTHCWTFVSNPGLGSLEVLSRSIHYIIG
jgi:hypothetical protein